MLQEDWGVAVDDDLREWWVGNRARGGSGRDGGQRGRSDSRDVSGRGRDDSWGGGEGGGGSGRYRAGPPAAGNTRVTDEARNDRRKPWERGDEGTIKLAVEER